MERRCTVLAGPMANFLSWQAVAGRRAAALPTGVLYQSTAGEDCDICNLIDVALHGAPSDALIGLIYMRHA